MNTSDPTSQNGHITTDKLRQLIVDELEGLDFAFDKQGNIVPPDTANKDIVKRLHETSRNIELQKKSTLVTK